MAIRQIEQSDDLELEQDLLKEGASEEEKEEEKKEEDPFNIASKDSPMESSMSLGFPKN